MNAFLVLVADDGGETAVEIENGERYVLGRGDDADVILNDVGASRHHAVLEQDPAGRWSVRDAGSSNGTFVNGARIETAVLGEDDEVVIGRSRLRFRTDAGAALADIAGPAPAGLPLPAATEGTRGPEDASLATDGTAGPEPVPALVGEPPAQASLPGALSVEAVPRRRALPRVGIAAATVVVAGLLLFAAARLFRSRDAGAIRDVSGADAAGAQMASTGEKEEFGQIGVSADGTPIVRWDGAPPTRPLRTAPGGPGGGLPPGEPLPEDGQITVTVSADGLAHVSTDGRQPAFCRSAGGGSSGKLTLAQAKQRRTQLCPRCLWFAAEPTGSWQWFGPQNGVRLVPVTSHLLLDRKTALLWECGPGKGKVDFGEASRRCRQMSVDGVGDWSLPDRRSWQELQAALAQDPDAPKLESLPGEYWLNPPPQDTRGTRNVRGMKFLGVGDQQWPEFMARSMVLVCRSGGSVSEGPASREIGEARRPPSQEGVAPRRPHEGLYPIPFDPEALSPEERKQFVELVGGATLENLRRKRPPRPDHGGYIDATGRVVVKITGITAASPTFSEGLAYRSLRRTTDGDGNDWVQTPNAPDSYTVFDGTYLKRDGSFDFQLKDAVSGEPFSEGFAAVRFAIPGGPVRGFDERDGPPGKSGYVDRTGRVVVPPRFEKAGPFRQGLARVQVAGKWGYIDKTGAWLVQPRFEQARDVAEGFAAVAADEVASRWGYIDCTGRLAIQFDDITLYDAFDFNSGLARIVRHGGTAYIDTKGEIVLTDTDNRAGDFSEGLAAVRTDAGWGFIDTTGRFAIAPQFEAAKAFSWGLAEVRKGDLWGYVSAAGKMVIPPQFQRTSPFDGDLAAVQVNRKMAYINRQGKVVYQD